MVASGNRMKLTRNLYLSRVHLRNFHKYRHRPSNPVENPEKALNFGNHLCKLHLPLALLNATLISPFAAIIIQSPVTLNRIFKQLCNNISKYFLLRVIFTCKFHSQWHFPFAPYRTPCWPLASVITPD